MRKWRPDYKCLYLIPEIGGNLISLEIILNRILPLRKYKNQEDSLVLLGGYLGSDSYGPEVLDILITIRKEYGDRIILIRGDEEEMMIRSVIGSEKDYEYWIDNGGTSTIEGYLRRAGIRGSAASIPHNRLRDIVDSEHIQFLQSLSYSHTHVDDYFFIHGGFNPLKSLEETNPITFAFDKSSCGIYKRAYTEKRYGDVEKMDEHGKIVVAVHNTGKVPVIFPRYMMLGGNAPKSLICGDLNSMEWVKVKRNKSRIYKTNIKIME